MIIDATARGPRWRLWAALLGCALLCGGCKEPAGPSAPSASAAAVGVTAPVHVDAAAGQAAPDASEAAADDDASTDGGVRLRIVAGAMRFEVEPAAADTPAAATMRAKPRGRGKPKRAAKFVPTMSTAPPVVGKVISRPATVQGAIYGNMKDVEQCYGRVAERDGTVAGRIVLRWTLGRDGMPTAVAVVQDTLSNPSVAACLKERARRWRFPPPDSGMAVITYPFDLRMQ